MHAKASVLWIIHLQARHFAQGKMCVEKGTSSMCIPAFQLMYNQICSTAVHMVSITGLPAMLETSDGGKGKRKYTETEDKEKVEQDKPKKQRVKAEKVEAPWNSLLKAKLEQPLKTAGNPSLKEIARYCNLLRDDTIIPDTKKDDCRQWMLFGKCRYGKKCRFNHNTATEAQANAVLQKLERFIAEPDGLSQGERK